MRNGTRFRDRCRRSDGIVSAVRVNPKPENPDVAREGRARRRHRATFAPRAGVEPVPATTNAFSSGSPLPFFLRGCPFVAGRHTLPTMLFIHDAFPTP